MVNFVVSLVALAFTLVFAGFVLNRWQHKHLPHLLLWGIGLVLYGIGTLAQAYLTAFNWRPGDSGHDLAFRAWYLTGAILTSAWLGQGSVYLLAPRRFAHIAMIVLGLMSLGAVVFMFTTTFQEPNYSNMIGGLQQGGTLTGKKIVEGGAIFTVPFNIYGTITLGGGALWSAYQFWRKKVMANRMIGNLFIAVGAFFPAVGGVLSDLHAEGFLYWGILGGAILMFVGFMKASAPATASAKIEQQLAVKA